MLTNERLLALQCVKFWEMTEQSEKLMHFLLPASVHSTLLHVFGISCRLTVNAFTFHFFFCFIFCLSCDLSARTTTACENNNHSHRHREQIAFCLWLKKCKPYLEVLATRPWKPFGLIRSNLYIFYGKCYVISLSPFLRYLKKLCCQKVHHIHLK